MTVVDEVDRSASGEPAGVSRVPSRVAETVAWLSVADADGLSEAECLEVITLLESLKGSAAALQARATVAFVGARDDDATQAAARGEASAREVSRQRTAARVEVALARRSSPSQASRFVGLARGLVEELPHTMATLTAGEISEWRATLVAKETATLETQGRLEADRRLAANLTRLGDKAIGDAARRACLDLDPESVVRRRSRAVASRYVGVRPAPDGMAYLSILGPMTDVVGAHASLMRAEQARYVATGDPEVDAQRAEDERSRGAWMADAALERLSGRADGEAQPVEVGLVMEESALFPARADAGHDETTDEAAGWVELPGWGAIPASMAREHLLRLLDQDSHTNGGTDRAGFWLRRLWTSPNSRDLVAMDSRQRFFDGGLRRLLQLRDPSCRVPWCDAPARQVDHVHPAAQGGQTSAANAAGLCQCHNLVKEEPGWIAEVTSTGLDPGDGRPHEFRLTSPTGISVECVAAPLFGAGRPSRPDAGRHRSSLLGTTWPQHESPLEAAYSELLDAA